MKPNPIRKLIASLVSLLLIFSSTVPAFAQESSGTITDSLVNPLYEGVITEADLNSPAPGFDPSQFFDDQEPDYTSDYAVAGTTMRAGMKKRAETIVVNFIAGEYSRQMLMDITNSALTHTGVEDEGDYLAWQYGGWKTKVTYQQNNGRYYYHIIFTMTYYTTAAQEQQVNNEIARLDSVLNPGSDPYQNTASAYRYLCENVTYDHDHVNDEEYKLQYTAYGALLDKTSVCQGYSVALYRLLLHYGVDNRVITGTGRSEPHAWNLIHMEDAYYNADSTWDAGHTDYSWFLKTSDTFKDHTRDEEYLTDAFVQTYPVGNPDYAITGDGTIQWSKDHRQATASYPTTGTTGHIDVPAQVSEVKDGDNVTATAQSTYTDIYGHVWNANETVSFIREDHIFNEPQFEWGDDHMVTGTLTCQHCTKSWTAVKQANLDESQSIPATWNKEGVNVYTVTMDFVDKDGTILYTATDSKREVVPKVPVKNQTMYRLYNPNSGEHFYTARAAEKDHLVSVGWRYEGIGWTAPEISNTPVYRLYNPNAGDHHYTTSKTERDHLLLVGWRDEGIGWYSDDSKSVPLYRQYNPNARAGSHNYTTSKTENDFLVSRGWRPEGIGWYAVK